MSSSWLMGSRVMAIRTASCASAGYAARMSQLRKSSQIARHPQRTCQKSTYTRRRSRGTGTALPSGAGRSSRAIKASSPADPLAIFLDKSKGVTLPSANRKEGRPVSDERGGEVIKGTLDMIVLEILQQ